MVTITSNNAIILCLEVACFSQSRIPLSWFRKKIMFKATRIRKAQAPIIVIVRTEPASAMRLLWLIGWKTIPCTKGSVYFGPLIALYFWNINRMGLSTNPLIRELIDFNKLWFPNLSLACEQYDYSRIHLPWISSKYQFDSTGHGRERSG